MGYVQSRDRRGMISKDDSEVLSGTRVVQKGTEMAESRILKQSGINTDRADYRNDALVLLCNLRGV